VHSKVRTGSKEEAERIGKYMIRLILSLKRLSLHEGQVLYQYGKHSSERESMDEMEEKSAATKKPIFYFLSWRRYKKSILGKGFDMDKMEI